MYTAFCEGFKILCLLLSIEIKSVISFTAMNNEQRLLMLILSQSNINEYGDEVVSNPTTAEGWKEIAASYSSQWNFHHVLGALDGKHIRIQCPANGGSQFCNYKRYHSIVLLALNDANHRFMWVQGRPQEQHLIPSCGMIRQCEMQSLPSRSISHNRNLCQVTIGPYRIS